MGQLYKEAHQERDEFYFIGKLICSQHSLYSYYVYGIKETDEYMYDFENKLTSKYSNYCIKGIFPTLCLFEIPPQCSDDEKKELQAAFALFWMDNNACANKLRRCIELLLNRKKIPKSHKQHRLNLKERIDKFEKEIPTIEITPYLQAIRIIGNIGSHQKEVTKEQLLDCFEFIDRIFEIIYLKKEKALKAKAIRIAKKK